MSAPQFIPKWAAILMIAAIPVAAAGPGYWKLAGNAEFWNKKLPPQGPSKQLDSSGYWVTVYDVSDGRVRFTASTARGNTNVSVTEVSWRRPPAVIVPGEVIPVAGRALVISAKADQVGLVCQVGRKVIRNGESAFAYMGDLFEGRNKQMARGASGAYHDYENTTLWFSQKGLDHAKNSPEIYLRYSVGRGSSASHSIDAFYRYQWVGGTVPPERAQTGSVPPPPQPATPIPAAPIRGAAGSDGCGDVAGRWTIQSGGVIGSPAERRIGYTGTLTIQGAGSLTGVLSFGSQERLANVSFSNCVLRFDRPLGGITQMYEGKVAGGKIEGSFTHGASKQYWRAEKGR